MMRLAAAIIILAFAQACAEKRVVTALPTPPERLICEKAGARPSLPAEYSIAWDQVRTVAAAKAEHERFVATLRTREGVVAGYLLRLEGQLHTCWVNAQWRREFEGVR